jgi:hypothetical protein
MLRDGVCGTIENVLRGENADDGIVDYNSWQESDEGRKLSNTLDKDIVLAEGWWWLFLLWGVEQRY